MLAKDNKDRGKTAQMHMLTFYFALGINRFSGDTAHDVCFVSVLKLLLNTFKFM